MPADFGSAEVCVAGLRRLCEDGHGLVATENGRAVAVMAVTVRENPVVGRALVDAALTWAYDHGYQWISVDFDTANPLSRPFWLNAGFRPAGYGLFRVIEPRR